MKLAAFNLETWGRVQVMVAERRFTVLPGAARQIHFEEMEFPAGVETSRAERVAFLRDTLLALKKKFGIKKAVFGLDAGMFACRVLEMPAMKERDLKGALAFELEKHLPLPPEDYIWRFAASPQPEGSGVKKVLVLAIKDDAAAWIGEAVKDTGIKLAGVRCSFLESINRLVPQNGKNKKTIYAHSGKTGSDLAVVEASVPQMMRTCRPSELKGEIEALNKDGAMGVCISGDTTGLQSLEHQNCPQGPAYALADSGFESPFRPKGRLRMDFSRAGSAEGDGRNYAHALWAMGGISLALFLLTPAVAFYKVKSASDSVRAETAALRSSAREMIDIKREMEDIKQKKEFLAAFQTDANRQIRALAALSRVLPSDAWLSAVSIDDKGNIEIKGFARKSAVLISLLGKSEFFKNVEFSTPVQTREGLEKFSIKMDMDTQGAIATPDKNGAAAAPNKN